MLATQARATTTVSQAFRTMLSRLELNPLRDQLASQRYNAVKAVIERELSWAKVTQIGSFQKKTKIRPGDLSDSLDIDVLVNFGEARSFTPASQGGVTPVAALGRVEQSLRSHGTYSAMRPKPDAPTVVLEYADNFTIELVPAYEDKMGGREHGADLPPCYIVGTQDGAWIPADYDYDAAIISHFNKVSNGFLVPAIKLIKGFMRNQNFGLNSFHVEILCALILPATIQRWNTQRASWDYQHLLTVFLQEAGRLLNAPVSLPGSFSPAVGVSSTDAFLHSIRLNQLGQRAEALCRMGDSSDVLSQWRGLIGSPFPAST